LEKLEDCPNCNRPLDQVEYDGQYCGLCDWVSAYVLMESAAARDVMRERRRQITEKDWSRQHDDGHVEEELAQAAACYALPFEIIERLAFNGIQLWPFDDGWTPKTRREDLVRAGAPSPAIR
jgi:hypothetical protein